MRIRRAIAADIPVMLHLESQASAASHWPQNQYESLFVNTRFVNTSAQPRSERLGWVAEDETGAPEVSAFLVARRVDAEWELENIVVAEKSRRRGVGKRLLDELIAHARAQQGAAIFLEVRESNQSARALYRKVGFEDAGLRKSYYSDPAEDAVLLRLALN